MVTVDLILMLTLQQYLPFTVLKLMLITPKQQVNWSCNSTYRLRYWNILDNQGDYIRITVATVPTVYGIETEVPTFQNVRISYCCNSTYRLRYWNPFTRLAIQSMISSLQQYLPFTVLKPLLTILINHNLIIVSCNSTYRLRYWNLSKAVNLGSVSSLLQQYLPFTVLKQASNHVMETIIVKLQQYLPFTVLKQY